MEKQQIKQITKEILKENNITTKEQIDTIKISEKNGLKVGNCIMKSTDIGALIYSEYKKHKKIEVNKSIAVAYDQKFEVKRLIIAYLLGMFFLEKTENQKIFAAEIEDENQLYENTKSAYFARNLLVPEEMLLESMSKLRIEQNIDISDTCTILSKEYNVPFITIVQRLEELNMIKRNEPKAKVRVRTNDKLTK